MIRFLSVLLLTCATACTEAQVSIITTIAGNGIQGYAGDNGPATNAELNHPCRVYLDHGNLYFPDGLNGRIRKVSFGTWEITTVAGSDTMGYSGDGGPATTAKLFLPEAVVIDTSGDLYLADAGNNRIRKVSAVTGIISTVAGNGTLGNSGDGGPATGAQLNHPSGLGIDKSGNLYIADYDNNKVRKVDASTGIISTVAGTGVAGFSGNGGPATAAQLNGVIQVTVDTAGDLFICEQWNNCVRKVNVSTGILSNVAGIGTAGYAGDNGSALACKLDHPTGLFIDKHHNIFIADYLNGSIRRIDALTGIITTVAGYGAFGYAGDDGPATNAKMKSVDVFLDDYGSMYIADYSNSRIRMVYNPKLTTPQQPAPSPLITIYPNPTQNELTIEYKFTNGEDGNFQITDLAGRVVATKVLTHQKEKETVNIAALSPGLYLYKVVLNNTVISAGKLIKE